MTILDKWRRNRVESEANELATAIRQSLGSASNGAPVIVIQNLTINYCSGGGATLNVKVK